MIDNKQTKLELLLDNTNYINTKDVKSKLTKQEYKNHLKFLNKDWLRIRISNIVDDKSLVALNNNINNTLLCITAIDYTALNNNDNYKDYKAEKIRITNEILGKDVSLFNTILSDIKSNRLNLPMLNKKIYIKLKNVSNQIFNIINNKGY